MSATVCELSPVRFMWKRPERCLQRHDPAGMLGPSALAGLCSKQRFTPPVMDLSPDVAAYGGAAAAPPSQCGIPDYHEDADLAPMTDDVAMRGVASHQSHAHYDAAASLPSVASSSSSRPVSSKGVHAPHHQAHYKQGHRQQEGHQHQQQGHHKRFVSEMFGDACKGAKEFQEDSHFMFTSPDGSVMVAGMFDGHGGKNGQLASKCATEVATDFFRRTWRESASWDEAAWKEKFVRLFVDMHKSIRERFIEDKEAIKARHGAPVVVEEGIIRKTTGSRIPIHGGTTGTVVAVVYKDDGSRYCVTANVGDSDALLCPSRTTGTPEFAADHLSVDHGPDSATEFNRIQRLDKDQYPHKLLFIYDKPGVLYKYNCPAVFRADGIKEPKFVENPWGNGLRPTNVRYDPAVYAVSPRGAVDLTCIAMTRSMGDFYAHQYGLSCIPDVSVRRLKPDCDYTIAVGSDGVWDCWRWEDFSDYLHQGNSTQQQQQQHLNPPSQHQQSSGAPYLSIKQLTTQLLFESVERAKANFGKNAYDDASIVLMRVGPNRPAGSAGKEGLPPSGSAASSSADYSPEPSPRAFVTDVAPVYRSTSSSSSEQHAHSNGRRAH